MKALKLVVASLALLSWHVFSRPDARDFLSGLVAHAQSPCPLRGSCELESGLQGRSDLLMFEDFERTGWQSAWTSNDFPQNVSAVSSPVFAGSRALEARVPLGLHDGASFFLTFRNIGISDPEELYFRYYVRFNDTWQRNGDGEIGKFPGFDAAYGTNAGHGCTRSTGTNGWSARMISFDRGSQNQVGFYAYHVDMPESCGEHMVWTPMLDRNRWYRIEAHVRVNTISGGRGNNDGVLEGWVDDQLAFRRTNLRFRDVSSLRIESIWNNVYVGGSWVADRNMAIHFDNMVVARNRIGGGGSSPDVPAAPQNLRIISSGAE
jgi:hypothetical protein